MVVVVVGSVEVVVGTVDVEVELDGNVGCGIDKREQHRENQPAGDRFGYAELAQKADGIVYSFADKQHHKRPGHPARSHRLAAIRVFRGR